MVNYLNIERNWNIIAHRPVYCEKAYYEDPTDYCKASSFKGRIVCLMHTFATPLKALSGLGLMVLSIDNTVHIIFAVLTLNKRPSHLHQAVANVIDVAASVVLLPIALIVNVARGVVGTIFHPGAMLKANERNDLSLQQTYLRANPMLQGTLINY